MLKVESESECELDGSKKVPIDRKSKLVNEHVNMASLKIKEQERGKSEKHKSFNTKYSDWLTNIEDKYSKRGGLQLWVDPRIPVDDTIFQNSIIRDKEQCYL